MHHTFAETHREGRQIISNLRSALIFKATDHPRVEEGRDLPAFASMMHNGVQILWTPTRGNSTDEIDVISITTPVCMRGQGKARQALSEFLQATDSLGLRVNTLVKPRDMIYTQRITEWLDDVGFTIVTPNSGHGVGMSREAQIPPLKAPTNLGSPGMPDLLAPAKVRDLAIA